jgi:hypothetical protein
LDLAIFLLGRTYDYMRGSGLGDQGSGGSAGQFSTPLIPDPWSLIPVKVTLPSFPHLWKTLWKRQPFRIDKPLLII